MKFRIKHADKIVGLFIIVALASLSLVIVMMGNSQRWFYKDPRFYAVFDSGAGLSRNMPVLYKGFTIGNVIDFDLNGKKDLVQVEFTIFEKYKDLVKEGSVVELMINPIGLGNQFRFFPGKGDKDLEDGDFIPRVGSKEAQDYIRQGKVDVSSNEDSISVIFSRVNSLIDELNVALGPGTDATAIGQIVRNLRGVVANLNEALGDGTDATEIGQIVGNVSSAVEGMKPLQDTLDALTAMLDETLANVNPVIADIHAITSDPDGLITALLGSDSEVYNGLVNSLSSLSGILGDLEVFAATISRQSPQIAGLINDIRQALIPATDVLEGLTNNPLLKKGISDRVELQSTGTNPRDNVQF
jgi:phospholipid/cholesterol/gamma-HCH transport system substrate-binding protein